MSSVIDHTGRSPNPRRRSRRASSCHLAAPERLAVCPCREPCQAAQVQAKNVQRVAWSSHPPKRILLNAKIRPHSTKTLCAIRADFIPRRIENDSRCHLTFDFHQLRHGILVVPITGDSGLPLVQKPPCSSTMQGNDPARTPRHTPGTGSKTLPISRLALMWKLSTP